MPRKGNPHTLKPFKKGHDPRRNTNGQPRKLKRLDQMLVIHTEGQWEGIIKALVAKAKRGDIRAAEVLLDRAYGKVKPGNEFSDFDFEPIDDDWPISM